MHVSRLLLFVSPIFLTTGLLAGCANKASTPEPASTPTAVVESTPNVLQPGDLNVCELLSPEDIKSALGGTVTKTTPTKYDAETAAYATYGCVIAVDPAVQTLNVVVTRHNPKSSENKTISDFWKTVIVPKALEQAREAEEEAEEASERASGKSGGESERERERERKGGSGESEEEREREKGKSESEREREEEREREGRRASDEPRKDEKSDIYKTAPRRLKGIGEDAFWVNLGVGGSLHVLKNENYLNISIGTYSNTVEREEKLRELAEIIIKKF